LLATPAFRCWPVWEIRRRWSWRHHLCICLGRFLWSDISVLFYACIICWHPYIWCLFQRFQ